MSSLGEDINILSGFAFKSERFNSDRAGLPLIRIRDVVMGHTSTFYEGPFDEQYAMSNGDILVGMDGEFNCARWKGGRALLNQRVCRVKSCTKRLDDGYLYWLLPTILKTIENRTPFVTVKHLSAKELRDYPVNLPPLSEQQRVAAILDQVDALRRKQQHSLSRLAAAKYSYLNNMVGDLTTNPKGWPEVTIGSIAESAQYGTSSRAGTSGHYPILRMNNLTYEGELNLRDLKYIDIPTRDTHKFLVRDGDILFNRTNSPELVGKTAVFRGERIFAFAGYLIRVRLRDDVNSEYVSSYLNSGVGKAKLRGMCKAIIGMANINAKELQSIRLPLPPAAIQRAFSEFVGGLAEIKAGYVHRLNRLDTLFAALQQQLFRNEGDLGNNLGASHARKIAAE